MREKNVNPHTESHFFCLFVCLSQLPSQIWSDAFDTSTPTEWLSPQGGDVVELSHIKHT